MIDTPIEADLINKMFDVLDKKYSSDDVIDYKRFVTNEMEEYTYNFISKKREAGHSIEYSDYVMLVVYPQFVKRVKQLKLWDDIDQVKLMLCAHDYANDLYTSYLINPINRYRIVRTFFKNPEKTHIMGDLKSRLPEFMKYYNEYVKVKNK